MGRGELELSGARAARRIGFGAREAETVGWVCRRRSGGEVASTGAMGQPCPCVLYEYLLLCMPPCSLGIISTLIQNSLGLVIFIHQSRRSGNYSGFHQKDEMRIIYICVL